MTYYCYLCNEFHHEGQPTEEHFIPRSIDGPVGQWLPACNEKNALSNSVFDSAVRDIFYWIRHQDRRILKRWGEALLRDGTRKAIKFAYDEAPALTNGAEFNYVYDPITNARISNGDVFAIKFPIGLTDTEKVTLCRGLAKISIGALAYLLRREGVNDEAIHEIFGQESFGSLLSIALNGPWSGNHAAHQFSLGRTDILLKLQPTCADPQLRNHSIVTAFREDDRVQIEGMLYSQYAWAITLPNKIFPVVGELRLTNAITTMNAPQELRDFALSPDSIAIKNPAFTGNPPAIPRDWE